MTHRCHAAVTDAERVRLVRLFADLVGSEFVTDAEILGWLHDDEASILFAAARAHMKHEEPHLCTACGQGHK